MVLLEWVMPLQFANINKKEHLQIIERYYRSNMPKLKFSNNAKAFLLKYKVSV